MIDRKELLDKLAVKIPCKWRVQSFSKNYPTAQCLAYIDARDVMDLLDKHATEGWQSDFKEVTGIVYGGIGIKINGEWEWRWDCGAESNMAKEKGEASDAFKRAAVKWGVGRFLYSLPPMFVKANKKKEDKDKAWDVYVVDDNGKKVTDLTTYINNKNK